MKLFRAAFKSSFPTSFFPNGDFLYQILSPGFCWCLLVKWKENSGSFIFVRRLLLNILQYLTGQRSCSVVWELGWNTHVRPWKSLHTRILFRYSKSYSQWNVVPLKTSRCISGSKPKCKANSHQVTQCRATCFWSPNYSSAKQLSASVFLTSRVASWCWPLPYSTSNAFIMILNPLKKV